MPARHPPSRTAGGQHLETLSVRPGGGRAHGTIHVTLQRDAGLVGQPWGRTDSPGLAGPCRQVGSRLGQRVGSRKPAAQRDVHGALTEPEATGASAHPRHSHTQPGSPLWLGRPRDLTLPAAPAHPSGSREQSRPSGQWLANPLFRADFREEDSTTQIKAAVRGPGLCPWPRIRTQGPAGEGTLGAS